MDRESWSGVLDVPALETLGPWIERSGDLWAESPEWYRAHFYAVPDGFVLRVELYGGVRRYAAGEPDFSPCGRAGVWHVACNARALALRMLDARAAAVVARAEARYASSD